MSSDGVVAAAQLDQAVDLLRTAAQAMQSATCSPAEEVRAIHAAVNALRAREADLLAQLDATGAPEREGCASVATWAAREFHQDAGLTRQMVRAATTMRELPSIGACAHAGTVSLEHLNALSYALRHCDAEQVIANEEDFTTLAEGMTPADLFATMRILRAVTNPDELDQAYLRGMDKADIQCLKLLDGFHVTGHLPTDLGAKFATFLQTVGVPRDGDDTRSTAQRRIDGFDELITTALGDGLPATGGIKPHLSVTVDAETLQQALNGAAENHRDLLDREPAILEGFGPIGPALLSYLAHGANLTGILVAGFTPNRTVLDAHRIKRLATDTQRRIIIWRQQNRCANDGCHHPIGEIHHITDWAHGGSTNLDNLAGLCRKCHSLITLGRLHMTGTHHTGYTFTRDKPLARTG